MLLRTLEAFARSHSKGIDLATLEAGSDVAVRTKNSLYRFVVLDPVRRSVLVSGGAFAERTEVRLEGATAGGSQLRLGRIAVGFRLELSNGRRRITTSPVRSVTMLSVATTPVRQ
jgi:hypothetical protein